MSSPSVKMHRAFFCHEGSRSGLAESRLLLFACWFGSCTATRCPRSMSAHTTSLLMFGSDLRESSSPSAALPCRSAAVGRRCDDLYLADWRLGPQVALIRGDWGQELEISGPPLRGRGCHLCSSRHLSEWDGLGEQLQTASKVRRPEDDRVRYRAQQTTSAMCNGADS